MEYHNRGNGDFGERDLAEIEREIAGTGAALESTVEELGEPLRPGQTIQDAQSYASEKASRSEIEAWERLRVRIRDNPVPLAALIGGGLVGYVMSRRADRSYDGAERYAGHWANGFLQRRGSDATGRTARAGELRTQVASLASDLGMHVAARGSEFGDQAAERARELTHRVREASGALGAKVQEAAGQNRRGLASLLEVQAPLRPLEEQPLLIGVASFALGALVGRLFSRRASDAVAGRADANRAAEAVQSVGPRTGGVETP